MNEEELMKYPEYRKEFEMIARKLGEKYGQSARDLLNKIKKRKELSLRESNDRAH